MIADPGAFEGKYEYAMKNTSICPKCQSTDIFRIVDPDVFLLRGNTVPGGMGRIPVIRLVCSVCGFTEEWIEGDLALRQLKQHHKRARPEEGGGDSRS